MISEKKILITGATGFVGSNLIRRCLQNNAIVHILTRSSSNKWRISDLLDRVVDHEADLLDNSKLSEIVKQINPQVVFHTAVFGGRASESDSEIIKKTNWDGTNNLVNACKECDLEIFVNTGSSSEYGTKLSPMRETDSLEPNSVYGKTKAATTEFVTAVGAEKRIPFMTLRLFSPYGYYEAADRLIPFAISSFFGKKDFYASSSTSVRDFIFIEDVMDAYMKTVELRENLAGQVINIGSGVQHSVGDVVKEIQEIIGSTEKIFWNKKENPRIEPEVWQADISKAKEVLSWQPNHDFREGLKKTIEWFSVNINLYN